MTLVGKIFIVLVFIMSLVFMSFAVAVYSTHQNWKDHVQGPNGLRNQLTNAKDANRTLEGRVNELKNLLAFERAARREAIAGLEQKRQEKEQLFNERNEQYNTLLSEHQTAIKNVEIAQTQLERLKEQIRDLRTNILAAQQDRDEQFAKVRDLTNQLNEMEGLKIILERRLAKLRQDHVKLTTVMKAYNLTPDTPVTNIPPQLEAKVLGVERDMIKISVGEDDGIRKGHLVEVSRRDRYLGRAKITKVLPDRAAAQMVKQIAPIQEGDHVETKIR